MIAGLLAPSMMTTPVPLLIGGMLSPLQVLLMTLFLLSSGFIFTVVKKEMSITSALGVSGGLWLISATMTFLML